jgi:RING finger protein 170
MSYLSDLPTILRHLWQELFSERGPLLVRRLYLGYILLILLVYLLLPFDILPESALGVLGYLDDLVLILLAVVYISFLYRAFLSRRIPP